MSELHSLPLSDIIHNVPKGVLFQINIWSSLVLAVHGAASPPLFLSFPNTVGTWHLLNDAELMTKINWNMN